MQLKSWILMAGIATGGILAVGSFDRAHAVTTTFYDLYDGSSNVTPDLYNSPNTYLGFTNLGVASQSASGGVTTLTSPESTTDTTYAGYSNYNIAGNLVNQSSPPIVLDNNAGYTLSFKVKINSQTNSNPYRAGFSIVVLGKDKKGIEIGFRNSDIFSQNNASFNTLGEQKTGLGVILGDLTTYDLTVSKNPNPLLDNLYTLTSGGNLIIGGFVRDYSATTIPFAAVYKTPNLIFLGDDTTSAGASVAISKITLTTNNTTSVPEPSSLLGIGLAIGLGATIKGRLSKIGRKVNKLSK